MDIVNQFLSEHRSCMRRARELTQEKSEAKQNAHFQPQFENKNPAHRAATDDLPVASRIINAMRQLLTPSMRRTVLEMFTNAPFRFLVPACVFCMAWMASQFFRGRAIGSLIDSLFEGKSQFAKDSSSSEAPSLLTDMLPLPIFFAFLEWLFNVLWDFCTMKAKTALFVNGRTRYFRSLLAQPLEFHSRTSSAELSARLISDSEAIDEAIVYAPCHLLRGIFTLIIAAYIISTDPWLFILGLSLRLPWLLQFVEYAITVVTNYELLESNACNIAQAHANEVFASIGTVQACTAEDEETENFKSHLECVSKLADTGSVVGCGLRNVENGLTLASEIIILAYGVSRVQNGQITFGMFLALKSHMEMFISQFNFFEKAYVAMKRASVQSSRLFHFCDCYASSVELPPPKPTSVKKNHPAADYDPALQTPVLEFSHVSFSYPALSQLDEARMPVVLSDVSFSVPRRSTTAILGASGSGKSSIAKLILQFYQPSSGSVYLHGVACQGSASAQRTRELVSWVDQDCCLMNRSIKDNLVMGLNVKPGELQIHHACKIAQIHDHIESLPDKYNTLCGQRGSSLSGGQQQRLVIARALLRQPELLLLDEATSALDVETEDALVSALERWKDETGSALVVITHRIRTIKHCDAAIVLHHGMVKEFGAKDDLIAKQGDFYNQCIASI